MTDSREYFENLKWMNDEYKRKSNKLADQHIYYNPDHCSPGKNLMKGIAVGLCLTSILLVMIWWICRYYQDYLNTHGL